LRASGASVIATVHEHAIEVDGAREVTWSPEKDDTVRQVVAELRPRVAVYAAGLTGVDQCETNESLADRLHADVPAALAAWLAQARCRFVYVSTDHLWDGTKSMVAEDEPVHPVNAYARSKAKGEQAVTRAEPSALILRTNFFGGGRPWRDSLSDWMLKQLSAKMPFNAFTDAYFTPIAVPLLAEIIAEAVGAGLAGLYHACGSERLSKYDFAVRLARWHGLSEAEIRPGLLAEAGLVAPRPADMSLATQKISRALKRAMPTLDESFAGEFGPAAAART
jgi:dTDP-4-dehydrorhamnose reductase